MESDPDDDLGEPEGITGIITGLLKEPEKLAQLINIGRTLLGGPVNTGYPAGIGNVQRTGEPYPAIGGEVNPEARLLRLSAAIDQLEAADPEIVEHLEILARVARENPVKFKNLISMITLL